MTTPVSKMSRMFLYKIYDYFENIQIILQHPEALSFENICLLLVLLMPGEAYNLKSLVNTGEVMLKQKIPIVAIASGELAAMSAGVTPIRSTRRRIIVVHNVN